MQELAEKYNIDLYGGGEISPLDNNEKYEQEEQTLEGKAEQYITEQRKSNVSDNDIAEHAPPELKHIIERKLNVLGVEPSTELDQPSIEDEMAYVTEEQPQYNNELTQEEPIIETPFVDKQEDDLIVEDDEQPIIENEPPSVDEPLPSQIGHIARKYESRGDSSAIGYDKNGGTSYGVYQIASNNGTMNSFLNYLKREAPDIHRTLSSAGNPNTGNTTGTFPDAWRKLAKEGLIQEHESKFIEETHVRPVLKLARDLGANVSNPAIQEMLYSSGIQHSLSGNRFIINSIGYTSSDEEFIKKFYEERRKYAKRFVSDDAIRGVLSRYNKEERDILSLNSGKSSFDVGYFNALASVFSENEPEQRGTSGLFESSIRASQKYLNENNLVSTAELARIARTSQQRSVIGGVVNGAKEALSTGALQIMGYAPSAGRMIFDEGTEPYEFFTRIRNDLDDFIYVNTGMSDKDLAVVDGGVPSLINHKNWGTTARVVTENLPQITAMIGIGKMTMGAAAPLFSTMSAASATKASFLLGTAVGGAYAGFAESTGAFENAMDRGMTQDEARQSAAIVGAGAAVISMLSIDAITGGGTSKLINRVIRTVPGGKTVMGRSLTYTIAAGLPEAVEEGAIPVLEAAGIMTANMNRLEENQIDFDWDDIWQQSQVGAFLGFLSGGIVGHGFQSAQRARSEVRADASPNIQQQQQNIEQGSDILSSLESQPDVMTRDINTETNNFVELLIEHGTEVFNKNSSNPEIQNIHSDPDFFNNIVNRFVAKQTMKTKDATKTTQRKFNEVLDVKESSSADNKMRAMLSSTSAMNIVTLQQMMVSDAFAKPTTRKKLHETINKQREIVEQLTPGKLDDLLEVASGLSHISERVAHIAETLDLDYDNDAFNKIYASQNNIIALKEALIEASPDKSETILKTLEDVINDSIISATQTGNTLELDAIMEVVNATQLDNTILQLEDKRDILTRAGLDITDLDRSINKVKNYQQMFIESDSKVSSTETIAPSIENAPISETSPVIETTGAEASTVETDRVSNIDALENQNQTLEVETDSKNKKEYINRGVQDGLQNSNEATITPETSTIREQAVEAETSGTTDGRNADRQVSEPTSESVQGTTDGRELQSTTIDGQIDDIHNTLKNEIKGEEIGQIVEEIRNKNDHDVTEEIQKIRYDYEQTKKEQLERRKEKQRTKNEDVDVYPVEHNGLKTGDVFTFKKHKNATKFTYLGKNSNGEIVYTRPLTKNISGENTDVLTTSPDSPIFSTKTKDNRLKTDFDVKLLSDQINSPSNDLKGKKGLVSHLENTFKKPKGMGKLSWGDIVNDFISKGVITEVDGVISINADTAARSTSEALKKTAEQQSLESDFETFQSFDSDFIEAATHTKKYYSFMKKLNELNPQLAEQMSALSPEDVMDMVGVVKRVVKTEKDAEVESNTTSYDETVATGHETGIESFGREERNQLFINEVVYRLEAMAKAEDGLNAIQESVLDQLDQSGFANDIANKSLKSESNLKTFIDSVFSGDSDILNVLSPLIESSTKSTAKSIIDDTKRGWSRVGEVNNTGRLTDGDMTRIESALRDFSNSIKIEFSDDMDVGQYGIYNNGVITLNKNQTNSDAVLTMVHELGHAFLPTLVESYPSLNSELKTMFETDVESRNRIKRIYEENGIDLTQDTEFGEWVSHLIEDNNIIDKQTGEINRDIISKNNNSLPSKVYRAIKNSIYKFLSRFDFFKDYNQTMKRDLSDRVLSAMFDSGVEATSTESPLFKINDGKNRLRSMDVSVTKAAKSIKRDLDIAPTRAEIVDGIYQIKNSTTDKSVKGRLKHSTEKLIDGIVGKMSNLYHIEALLDIANVSKDSMARKVFVENLNRGESVRLAVVDKINDIVRKTITENDIDITDMMRSNEGRILFKKGLKSEPRRGKPNLIKTKALDGDGNKITTELTSMERISIAMTSLDVDGNRHITEGGFRIGEGGNIIKMDDVTVNDLMSSLSTKEKSLMGAIRESLDTQWGYVLATYKQLNGVDMPNSNANKAYFPLAVLSGDVGTMKAILDGAHEMKLDDIMNTFRRGEPDFLKGRTESSTKPLLIMDALDVLVRSNDMVSRYVGYAGAYQDASTMYNAIKGDAKLSNKSKHIVEQMGQLVADLNGHDVSKLDRKVNEIVSRLTGTTLGFRLSSAMKQVASITTAMPELDVPFAEKLKMFSRMANTMYNNDLKHELLGEMKKYSPVLHARYTGSINRDIGEYMYTAHSRERFSDYRTLASKGMRGIMEMDNAVIQSIWNTVKIEAASKHVEGSEQYWNYVAKKSEQIVRKTQPNFAAINRASVTRTNGVLKIATMFSSQPMRNMALFTEGVSQMYTGISSNDMSMFTKGFERSLYSSVVQTGTLLAMMSVLKGKDEDDKYLVQDFNQWTKALTGNVVFLRDIHRAYDNSFGAGNSGMIDGFLTDLGASVKTMSTKGMNIEDYTKNDIRKLVSTTRIMNIPLSGPLDTFIDVRDRAKDAFEN